MDRRRRRWRAYANALAHLAAGDVQEAVAERAAIAKGEDGRFKQRMLDELAGRIALARGLTLEGQQLLARAAHAPSEGVRPARGTSVRRRTLALRGDSAGSV